MYSICFHNIYLVSRYCQLWFMQICHQLWFMQICHQLLLKIFRILSSYEESYSQWSWNIQNRRISEVSRTHGQRVCLLLRHSIRWRAGEPKSSVWCLDLIRRCGGPQLWNIYDNMGGLKSNHRWAVFEGKLGQGGQ